jgi:D-alanine-D-alanine ligase
MSSQLVHLQSLGRIAVVMGGNSAEREVSLNSGKAVLRALQEIGVDAVGVDAAKDLPGQLQRLQVSQVFNVLHGRGGEDGQLQGLLEFMNIPYTGSGVLASALAMDKVMTKYIWQRLNIPTPEFRVLNQDTDWNELLSLLGTVVVKPVREGSSIGMSITNTAKDLKEAYVAARKYDSEVMAEKYIEGSELTVAILDREIMPAIELQTTHKFYDYEAKYIANDTRYLCPAPLSDKERSELNQLCQRAYEALGCEGWGRVDVMRDKQGNFWLLEVNTVPGMTDHSLVPMAAAAHGLGFGDLIVRILKSKSIKKTD